MLGWLPAASWEAACLITLLGNPHQQSPWWRDRRWNDYKKIIYALNTPTILVFYKWENTFLLTSWISAACRHLFFNVGRLYFTVRKIDSECSEILSVLCPCFSYILAISVSVRLPSDQAALARTFGDRSSRAARIVFAVSATNITSWKEKCVYQIPVGPETCHGPIVPGGVRTSLRQGNSMYTPKALTAAVFTR